LQRRTGWRRLRRTELGFGEELVVRFIRRRWGAGDREERGDGVANLSRRRWRG
jgi:hypothetical protein